MNRKKIAVKAPQFILCFFIILLLVIMLYPLAMSFWNSFKTDLSYDKTKWYPTLPVRVKNVAVAFDMVKTYIFNTVIVAVAGPVLMLIISALASYTFARMDFPFKKTLYSMVIMLMMIPGALTLVPQYILYRSLGLYDSLFALILPICTGGCVLGVFLMTSFFAGLPKDVFEAAKIDGANEINCFFKIAMPLCIPIMATLFIMQIINIWNDYLWPRIMLTENKFTISAGLMLVFQSEYSINYPVMFAGYLVSSLPLILIFIYANKFYIEGLVSTSIKL